MKKLIFFLTLCALPVLAAPPILRAPLTTNTPTASSNIVINIADARIAADATHQQTNNALTSLSTNNAVNLTNLQASAIAGMKYTGIVSNLNAFATTNFMFFTNGILVTNKIGVLAY